MRVALIDFEHHHVSWVDLPDTQKPPQTILRDGLPFIRIMEAVYKISEGAFHSFTEEPIIKIVRKFSKPVVVEAMSTRWFNGCVGEAKFKTLFHINPPWAGEMSLNLIDTRAIRVHGVWSPDIDNMRQPREMRGAAEYLGNKWRRRTNDFCNVTRKPGSKLLLTLYAIDNAGRIVCEVQKKYLAMNKDAETTISLRKHLLEDGLFTPARWSME